MSDVLQPEGKPGACQLCNREHHFPGKARYHLIPRITHQEISSPSSLAGPSSTGTPPILLCALCHRFVHNLLPNKSASEEFDTIDKLASHPEVVKYLKMPESDRQALKSTTWAYIRRLSDLPLEAYPPCLDCILDAIIHIKAEKRPKSFKDITGIVRQYRFETNVSIRSAIMAKPTWAGWLEQFSEKVEKHEFKEKRSARKISDKGVSRDPSTPTRELADLLEELFEMGSGRRPSKLEDIHRFVWGERKYETRANIRRTLSEEPRWAAWVQEIEKIETGLRLRT